MKKFNVNEPNTTVDALLANLNRNDWIEATTKHLDSKGCIAIINENVGLNKTAYLRYDNQSGDYRDHLDFSIQEKSEDILEIDVIDEILEFEVIDGKFYNNGYNDILLMNCIKKERKSFWSLFKKSKTPSQYRVEIKTYHLEQPSNY